MLIDRKNDEIYPAIEVVNEHEMRGQHKKKLKLLGFKWEWDNHVLSLPDKEALLTNWEKLEIRQELPALHICSGEGIVSDRDYIEAFLKYDMLLSDEEFIHDSLAHVIRTLLRIFESKSSYTSDREKVVQCFNKFYQTIEQAKQVSSKMNHRFIQEKVFEKLEFSLSIFADLTSGADSRFEFNLASKEDFFTSMVRNTWEGKDGDPVVKSFIKKRFGEEKIGHEPFHQVWKEVTFLASHHEEFRS